MYLIETIPITAIPFSGPGILNYLSVKKLKKGVLISVPLNKRTIKALVLNCWDVAEKKLEIKKSGISLKSIFEEVSQDQVITNQQLSLASYISEKYLESLGLCLKAFIPPTFLKRKRLPVYQISDRLPITDAQPKPILLWGQKRIDSYLDYIQKAVKDNKSVFLLFPEITKFTPYLQKIKKVAPKTVIYHAGLEDSEKLKIWQKVLNNEISCIVGTRSAIFLPFNDLGLIIVDEEENPNHISWDQHPKFNAKDIALKLAEFNNCQVVLGADLPEIVSYYKTITKEFELVQVPLLSGIKTEVIDMKNEKRWGNFSLLSEKLQREIKKTIEHKKQVILFVNRKGLATTIICKKCGYVEKCDRCSAPMVYHKHNNKDILICHHCLFEKKPLVFCPKCKGTKIKYFGAGTDKVNEELHNFLRIVLPEFKVKISLLEAEITPLKQKRILESFKQKKADILIATQTILKYPDLEADLVVAVMPDFMLNLPDYSSAENAMQIFFNLKILGKKFFIQTYKPDLPIFEYLKSENYKKFFEEELEQRKAFSYPPFSEIIKFTFSSKSYNLCLFRTKELEKILKTIFSEQQILGPAPAFISKVRERYVWNIIVKVNSNEQEKLKSIIPSFWETEVNPKSLI